MNYRVLNPDELSSIRPGEAITVAGVMAIIIAAVMAVVVYRLFRSGKGTVTIPGGFKFDWK